MRAATWQMWFVVWTMAAGVSWGQTPDAPPAVVLTAEATPGRSPFEASLAAQRSQRPPAGEPMPMPMSLRNIDPTRTLELPPASVPPASVPPASLRPTRSPRDGGSVLIPPLWSVSYLLGI